MDWKEKYIYELCSKTIDSEKALSAINNFAADMKGVLDKYSVKNSTVEVNENENTVKVYGNVIKWDITGEKFELSSNNGKSINVSVHKNKYKIRYCEGSHTKKSGVYVLNNSDAYNRYVDEAFEYLLMLDN
ncbi:hypothetical protein [Clostridium kluyveri]|uniref:Uncharacterized protein n=1 Tax=Clostridium kluyveri TaxID=1534 RepID=A0A1L5F7S2_CLOKL|nr:hypothetical protein [Clostridium kluyveri]APM39039.1 hypothetical protein BS101_09915 [Clostridium kluyveri]UZQ51365.1 hypothetical protein OP486_04090 [Clostridium kluyveri]